MVSSPPRPSPGPRRWLLRGVFAIVGLIALAILYAGTAFVPPISGRVVDAVTGEPIEGIAVTLEYTRYHGLGPTTTVAYAQATTGSSGRFWLKPLVGWSGLLFPAIGEHWLTVNHVHDTLDGSFGAAEVQVLYNPRSNQRGGRVGDPRYFPVTLAYSRRMPCGLMNAWSATCVDEHSGRDITIQLVPAVDDPGQCGRISDATLQDRCRQLTAYRAAFRARRHVRRDAAEPEHLRHHQHRPHSEDPAAIRSPCMPPTRITTAGGSRHPRPNRGSRRCFPSRSSASVATGRIAIRPVSRLAIWIAVRTTARDRTDSSA